jgi:flagellar hook-associated protein 2
MSFSDGTKVTLPAIGDSNDFAAREYSLGMLAAGKTISALSVENSNTHRDISLRNIEVVDPLATGDGLKPLNVVSTAQDAILSMEGIEMKRSSNSISDIVPGVTLNLRGVSERPVSLNVRLDRDAVKEALINLVGNYNRLMAEINVLTARSLPSGFTTNADEAILNELSYLTADERAEMKSRLGAFNGDSTINQFKSRLQQTISAPYPTSEERDMALLSQIGIGTNLRGNSAGYDPSRLRGYLEIDEKILDAALETKMSAVKQLFGSDTTGDLLIDTGVAFGLDAVSKPFVETGGLISLKTGTIDSRISQDQRRITSMERQLAAKEADLKMQYGRMENAYSRMEQMTSSFDNFAQRNNNNR